MTAFDYVRAARVPRTVPLGEFGLWTIERRLADGRPFSATEKAMSTALVGFPDYTLLRHYVFGCEMGAPAEIVMEDSVIELSKHLPIWMHARGDVLVTGLGLGCVVRGLLANPRVDRVFVVEKDPTIIELIGPEFWGDSRVTIYLDDAMRWEPGDRLFRLRVARPMEGGRRPAADARPADAPAPPQRRPPGRVGVPAVGRATVQPDARNPHPRGASLMKPRAVRDVYIAVMVAAAKGTGLRLTAYECRELSFDDAIATRAMNALDAADWPQHADPTGLPVGWETIDPRRPRQALNLACIAPEESS